MHRLKTILLIVLVTAIGASSGTSSPSSSEPITILDSLKSGDTEQAVRQTLSAYRVLENERIAENQYHKSHLILEVRNYQTSNCFGKLLLQFYDGGLYDVWFYPDDVKSYLDQLKKEGLDLAYTDLIKESLFLDKSKEIQRNGLKIWYTSDAESKQYIGREDLQKGQQIEEATN